MFEKLKDGANKLKAKIGGDDLDEKLVEVVSQQNWQASTQQLHEIASAAYNYEKWQRINEFIWDKLKKSKSWKKILKTFNLIEFLLKNGPPSIISNFKYDLYQLRTFESYSSYVEGLDKGEPIRERAKVVVGLLGNEELLEEERVKAKNIREKMANVVGGAAYSGGYSNSSSYGGSSSGYGNSGGYGGSGGSNNYGGSGSYGSKNEEKKKPDNKTYDYGNSLGAYGDYTYNKSTLDKYKDVKNDKPSTTTDSAKEEKQPEIKADTRKPFEKIASKLSKPGEKKEVEVIPQVTTYTAPTAPATTTSNGNGNIIDIFEFGGGSTSPAVQTAPQQQPFAFNEPAKPAPVVQQPVQQPQAPIQQAPQQSLYPPQQGYPPQGVSPQSGFPQQQQQYPPQYPPQQYPPQQQQFQQQQQFPNQYGLNQFGQPNQFAPQFAPQQPPFNQYGQYPPQQQSFAPQTQYGYQQQPYNPAGQQQQAQYNPYAAMQQQQQQPPNPAFKPSGNLNTGITLNTTTATKKEDDFGNFSSSTSTAQNVNWLSSTEKGLLDFSDFGSELKKEGPKQNKQEVSNNIQIDAWSW